MLHWELPRLLRGLGLLDWGLLSRGLLSRGLLSRGLLSRGLLSRGLGEEAADEEEVEDVENEEEGNFLAVEEEGLVRVLGVTGWTGTNVFQRDDEVEELSEVLRLTHRLRTNMTSGAFQQGLVIAQMLQWTYHLHSRIIRLPNTQHFE